MKKPDPRLKMALTFLVTFFILFLCLVLEQFRWLDRSSDKFSRLDLLLAPIGLTAGLAVGAMAGRWRFEALKEMAPLWVGRTAWREKSVNNRSESGQKALNLEQNSYAALFYLFLAVWAVTKAYFMPVCSAAFFVLGVWLAGQTVPYFRFWLWQHLSGSETSSDVSDARAALSAEAPERREKEPVNVRCQIGSKKRFDPRLRVVLILISTILCLMIGWSLPKELSLGTSGLFGDALVLTGLAAGFAIGVVIGRQRLRALQEVAAQLAGTILFHEPSSLSHSDFGRKAMRTERVVIGAACLLTIAWEVWSKSLFLPTDTLIYFLLSFLLASQAAPYFRFWLSQRSRAHSPTDR